MTRRDDLPEGTVTFLFTDIEGSTRMLQELGGEAYVRALSDHRRLLRETFTRHAGVEVDTQGDSFFVAFASAPEAVAAAAAGQRVLHEHAWEAQPVRVRMGLHTGEPLRVDRHYTGLDVHWAARVMSAAHGGQVLVSQRTAELVGDGLPDAPLVDLGEHRLKDLATPQRLYQLGEGAFPPLKTISNTNLPRPASSFVGRERELAEILSRINAGARILTLTGPGGSGKTRLALRAAQSLVDAFRDGVFLVELTPLAEASLVAPAIAEVLGVQKTAGRAWVDSLVTHLGGKELLLVLDNFEHVVRAAPEVSAIVAAAPKLRVLATSRLPLHIQGERELHVGPLPLPEPGATGDELLRSPSVQLFLERAHGIREGVVRGTAGAGAVAEICRRLDGLPLAIELAAGRTRLLSPEALLERLVDRLGFLTGGAADLPSRQRTLRDAIRWSYDLLDEPERTTLRRLGIFRGGCSLTAAEAVCDGDVLSSLTVLVEHNLVVSRWDELGESRFEMLETIAEFARGRLADSGEEDDVARRHASYFADYAELIEPSLYTDARMPWLRRLADDRDNVRAALAWSADRDEASYGLRILGALWLWWWTQFSEGLGWADRLLPLPSAAEDNLVRARALFTAEICAAGTGDVGRIREYVQQAVRLSRELGADEMLALAQSLGAGALAGMTSITGFDDPRGPARLQALSEEAIRIGQRTGNRWVAAWTKMISGLIALLSGNAVTAGPWAAEAVAEFTALGDSWSRGTATMVQAFSLIQLGELEAAHAALEGSAPALLNVGDLKIASSCLIAHGLIARFSGDPEEAERRYGEALELCVRAGDPNNAPLCLEGIAAAVAAGEPERAAELLGAARALFDTGHFPTVPGFDAFSQATSATIDAILGAAHAEQLRSRGAARAGSVPLAELL